MTASERLLSLMLEELLTDCDDLCDVQGRNMISAATMVRARQALAIAKLPDAEEISRRHLPMRT